MALLDYTGLIRFKNKLQQLIDAKSPSASPALTGVPTAPTAPVGTDSTQIATTGFVMRAVAYTGDREFMGTYGKAADSPTITALPSSPQRGWAYTVISDGLTLNGKSLNIEDTVVCANPSASGDAKWVVLANNQTGTVRGPASATSGGFPVFDGTSGRVLKDSGVTASTVAEVRSYLGIT